MFTYLKKICIRKCIRKKLILLMECSPIQYCLFEYHLLHYNVMHHFTSFHYSVAKCLGALKVCKRSYEWLQSKNVISCVVPDREALNACVFMAGMQLFTVDPLLTGTLYS